MRISVLIVLLACQFSLAQDQTVADCRSGYSDRALLIRNGAEYRLSFQYSDETQTLVFKNQPVRVEYADCAARLRYYEGNGVPRVDILIKDPKGEICVTPETKSDEIFAIFSVFNGNPGYISSYAECALM
ncbi:MAG: hypothetical protein KDD39_02680 [Bdellovibrionales bacterium]|nr:hypothetical protein [Bdellovibrionales bacterium]